MAKQPKAKKKTMQQAAPFASYMGLHLEDQREDDEKAKRAEKEEEWAKKAETDPDREQMEDESDDDYAARMEEMDEEEEEKAEGEINDTDPDAEEDEEDDEKPNAKAARASERKRCARIIAYGVKANNVHQAAVFAFDTNLSASQAISAMNAANMTTPNGGLNNRMQGVKNYHVGSNAGGNDQKGQTKSTAQANGILSALEAVRGK